MASKGKLENNEKKRKLAQQKEASRQQLKKLLMDRSATLEQRFESALKLAQMPRNSSQVRFRRRCVETGRPRGVYRFCGLSRIIFREKASHGQIPGIRRSSW